MVFAIHWHESAMDSHVFPTLNPPPASLHTHPSGSSQCTSPKHLSHASNLGWWSVSHMIMYMFRCCSLRSSHPRLLPWSWKVCSIHLCLFFCLAYRVIITIFLNQKDKHQYSILTHIYGCVFHLFLFLSLSFFSQLSVRAPQINILPSCISFSSEWFWSSPPLTLSLFEGQWHFGKERRLNINLFKLKTEEAR